MRSSNLPSGQATSSRLFQSIPVLLQVGFTLTHDVTTTPVSSYLAFSPLPLSRRLFSVALSLKSPSPDVIRHLCSVELGLSSSFYWRDRLTYSFIILSALFKHLIITQHMLSFLQFKLNFQYIFHKHPCMIFAVRFWHYSFFTCITAFSHATQLFDVN